MVFDDTTFILVIHVKSLRQEEIVLAAQVPYISSTKSDKSIPIVIYIYIHTHVRTIHTTILYLVNF
jgi:hypothetical protein